MFDMGGISDEERADPLFYDRRQRALPAMASAGTQDSSAIMGQPEDWPAAAPADYGSGGIDVPHVNAPRGTNATGIAGASNGAAGSDRPITGSPTNQSISMAGPNDDQLALDQKKLSDLKTHGSPISRIHNPFLRGMAQVGDVVGSTFLPGYAAMPWTQARYRGNLGQAEHTVAEDLGEQKSQAVTEQERAKAIQERAKAQKDLNPDHVKDEQLLYDKNGTPIGYRDEQGKYYSPQDLAGAADPQLQAVSRIIGQARPKEAAIKEGEMPLGERVDQLNQMLTERYRVLNPGQALPAHYTIAKNATQKDYDRIDKALEAEEKAKGTQAQQQQASQMREAMLEIARQGLELRKEGAQDKKTAALDKKTAPLKQSIDDAATAHQLADLAEAGNAEADVDLALSFFKTMRSGGQGIRFTRQEQDLIMGARSSGQDLMAGAQKVLGHGEKFTPDQRRKIVQVIDLHAQVAKQALDRIQNEGSEGANTIHYREGKVDYDIPAEKEADFKAKHPKAQKQ